MSPKSQAQLVLATNDLSEEIAYFSKLGFQLDNIFPADDPAVAFISGHGLHIRLDRNAESIPATIHLLNDEFEAQQDKEEWIAPNGTRFIPLPKTYELKKPLTQHKFEVRKLKDSDSWVIGRAGMLYRDLVPDRLGGSIIASHINIPEGGPVPDMVHYHTIGFQLIFCYKGWVKLVYEDQGPPFILKAGDCVTQPPEIRHQVLEASDNLEVIEIGVPSEHMTTIDHQMELPTPHFRPDREFQGQVFCHHKAENATWRDWKMEGLIARDSGINTATKGIAGVLVIKSARALIEGPLIHHEADILFNFVMDGTMYLNAKGYEKQKLSKGDAFVIPPGLRYQFLNISKDFELLEVSLPGIYKFTSY